MTPPTFLDHPSRVLFFTGKGGVGKTTTSCSLAIRLARQGKKLLLVCTDPASNLDDVLGCQVPSTPALVSGVQGLMAMNINPEEAARRYREKVVGPYRGILPDEAVASIEEQLSGACTVEIAAFAEFAKLLGDPEATAAYDHIIFDTAPTGHTLRLLELPAAWTTFIDTNTSGTSCLGPLEGLKVQHELFRAAMKRLQDKDETTLVLVAGTQEATLTEAERTRKELAGMGVMRQELVINGMFTAMDTHDPVARAMEEESRAALAAIPQGLALLPCLHIGRKPMAMLGVEALATFFDTDNESQPLNQETTLSVPSLPGLLPLVEDLAARQRGVVMTMGKGGVGKTTMASAIALALARRGLPVHLTTTDPAAHLAHDMGDTIPSLTVSTIDPEIVTAAYTAEVMEVRGRDLDEDGRKLLEEELRSPCTEEIAVFQAFARKVEEGKDGFVVMDTAPTGHTLLLLDATEAYHRQVSRSKSELPDEVVRLLPRLRDLQYTSVFLVTLPESTPVAEAASLQEDLRRAGIEPAGWVVNRSLQPLSVTDPGLVARRQLECAHVQRVAGELSQKTFLVGWRQQNKDFSTWLEEIAG